MTIAGARDAASLIVYRNNSNALEVLMGRRRKQAKFAPGVYVFPGGTLDAADNISSSSPSFKTDGLSDVVRTKIHALANAAIRETWEETGLLLAEKGKLAQSLHPSWEQLRLQGMAPSPQHLDYLGRAITPSDSPTRFHARFFVASFKHFSGVLIDEGELLDLRWVPLEQPANLPMYDVTEFMLDELKRFFAGSRSATPILSYRQNRTLIRYE
jgi:8-oxo-dGTP pyrophosphatase MutT (NUDIX family)